MRTVLLLVAVAAALCVLAVLPAPRDRVHVVRNGNRTCVYTTDHRRIFPADAGACEGVQPEE